MIVRAGGEAVGAGPDIVGADPGITVGAVAATVSRSSRRQTRVGCRLRSRHVAERGVGAQARKQLSSGIVESLNNKAKLTTRKSYGFRTFRGTKVALYHARGKLLQPDVSH